MSMGKWYNAFVFNEEDECFQVYEVFEDVNDPDLLPGQRLRTNDPVQVIVGASVEDAIRGLENMIQDLRRDRIFKTIEELDKELNIG
jgi:hypothetical protein